MNHIHCNELNHEHGEHNHVSKKDRLAMLLMVLIAAGIFLRPFIALQNTSRGDSFLNYGFYGRAISQYKRAILLDKDNSKAYSWLGYAYNRNGDTDKAIESYKKAIELNPKDIEVNFELGSMYYVRYQETREENCYKKAIKSFEKVLEIDPSNVNAKLMLDNLNEKDRVKGNE
ncbi:MAG TPA: tetratricopeptide repeat protein [Actinobacteria bacterium]|nr:tetratricopeptide repeat protein [Actinomycetota bacterium]